MSKIDNVRLNALMSILFTLTIGILSFLVNKLFSEYLGQNNLGLFKLFTQMIAYLSLAELGVSGACSSFLYRYLAKREYDKAFNILHTISFFYKRVAISILILGIIANLFLPYIVNDVDFTVHICWTVYVVATAITYLYAKYPIFFSADKKIKYVIFIRNILRVLLQILQICVIIYTSSFFLFVLVVAVSNLIEWALYSYYFKKKYSNITVGFSKKINKGVIKKTKQLFIHSLAGVLVFNTDYIVISKYIGLEMVAVYASYLMITKFMEMIVNNIVDVIKPTIGHIYTKNSTESNIILFKQVFALNFCSGLIIISFLFVFIDNLMIFWMGKDYLLPKLTVFLILLNMFFNIIRKTVDVFKEASGYFDDVNLAIFEGLVNFITSIILVNYLGVNGVIIGTIISNVLVIMIMKPFLVFKNVLQCDFSIYIKDLIFYFLIGFVVICSLSVFNNVYSEIYAIMLSIIMPFSLFLLNCNFKSSFGVVFRNEK